MDDHQIVERDLLKYALQKRDKRIEFAGPRCGLRRAPLVAELVPDHPGADPEPLGDVSLLVAGLGQDVSLVHPSLLLTHWRPPPVEVVAHPS
jgi:hypothetical protein